MKTVYILTREGREYTEEGCDYVRSMISDNYNDDDQFIFAMGSVYNNGKYLKELLEEKPDSYVAVSTSQNIFIVSHENIQSLIMDLNDEETSWTTAVIKYDQTFGTHILKSKTL